MSGNSLLLDTNVSLYLLSKDDTLAAILQGRDIYLSFITELELMGYNSLKDGERLSIKKFIQDCIVIDINTYIKEAVIEMRQKYSVKLPDSIIAATALYLNVPLLTADKGFKKIKELNLLLYEQ